MAEANAALFALSSQETDFSLLKEAGRTEARQALGRGGKSVLDEQAPRATFFHSRAIHRKLATREKEVATECAVKATLAAHRRGTCMG